MIIRLTKTNWYCNWIWGLQRGMVATVTCQGVGEYSDRVQIVAHNVKCGGYDRVWLNVDEFEKVWSIDDMLEESLGFPNMPVIQLDPVTNWK